MLRYEIVDRLLETKAVAVVRLTDSAKAGHVARALAAGGLTGIEITMTVPGALDIIRDLAATLPDSIILGVGSVTDEGTARDAVDAGARFVVSPVCTEEVLGFCDTLSVPVLPGAFTPTEILRAHRAGAEIVKVFPADRLGPAFVKAVLAPLPGLRIMPTGGISAANAADWIRAGACCLGVGGALLDKQAIAEERWDVLTENARELMQAVRSA